MTTVKLTGFKELDHALSQLPKATARNVLRRVGKAALEPMADAAAAKAPVREGKLSFSIVVSETRTRRASGNKTRFIPGVGFRRDPKTSLDLAMGPAGGLGVLPYASFVEFGTVDTPAQPFMRPAWDAGAHDVIVRIGDGLAVEINKAATRLAKRRAKAAR